jgi:hypothetical protein
MSSSGKLRVFCSRTKIIHTVLALFFELILGVGDVLYSSLEPETD